MQGQSARVLGVPLVQSRRAWGGESWMPAPSNLEGPSRAPQPGATPGEVRAYKTAVARSPPRPANHQSAAVGERRTRRPGHVSASTLTPGPLPLHGCFANRRDSPMAWPCRITRSSRCSRTRDLRPGMRTSSMGVLQRPGPVSEKRGLVTDGSPQFDRRGSSVDTTHRLPPKRAARVELSGENCRAVLGVLARGSSRREEGGHPGGTLSDHPRPRLLPPCR